MKLMTFSEINDLENGQQISSFQGIIKKVLDQKTGEGDFGPWTLQTLFLQDEHANELTVTWTSPDPWDVKNEGKHVLFESGYDKKGQIVGLKREIRTKGDKRYESVKVDDRAKVKITQPNGNPNNTTMDHGDIHHGVTTQKPDWSESPSGYGLTGWGSKSKSSILDERQRAIIRQHSQSMALEVLKLKVTLNELTVSDLTPSKLKSLADYFDEDVLGATT